MGSAAGLVFGLGKGEKEGREEGRCDLCGKGGLVWEQ